MKEIHIICNPISGQGKTLSVLEPIKQWLTSQPDIKAEIHMTENIGHATAITRNLSSIGKPVTIISLGGDGTLSEILNGIKDFENVKLGILPFGSGNDFIRTFKWTENDPITLFSSYVNETNMKKIDYLLINDKYRAINEAGLGMSAEVINCRDKMKHFSPSTQYKLAALVKSLFWRSFDYEVSFDKQPFSKIRTMWFTVNNGNYVGSGLMTSKGATPDDGIINITYVKPFSHLVTLPTLVKVKKGKIEELKKSVKLLCKEVDIKGQNMTLEFDGNLIKSLSSINIKIVPSKINLLLP